MKFFETDTVKVQLDKINDLYFSNPKFCDSSSKDCEGEGIPKFKLFLKQKMGIIIESDFCKKKNEWSYFVSFEKGKNKYWFLESELYLI